jgi:ubiquinone/menaquinone biosynthesis C-methylase UbiE
MRHEKVAGFYNNIQQKFGTDYETERWFRTPITRSHFKMAHDAIMHALGRVTFTSCIELGPGAGTWTKVLLEKKPSATFTLLDISETMLGIAQQTLHDAKNVEFVVSDFLAYTPTRTYDLFFSSRALEYILDKQAAMKQIHTLLSKDGQGILITKNPRYWAYKLLGRKIPELHRNQITPKALVLLLEQAGFRVTSLRPATVTVPFFKSATLNTIAFFFLKHTWLPVIHRIFAESYIVHFVKYGD